MTTPEKLIIVVTHGPEDPELATLPFVMAAAAIVSDVEVAMAFQGAPNTSSRAASHPSSSSSRASSSWAAR
jgi:hypothetical protein